MMHAHPNVLRLIEVARRLDELRDEFVFVGGSTVTLLTTRPVTHARATKDVDCIVEVTSQSEYHALDARLRSKGFVNDSTSRVICRYRLGENIFDLMPTDPTVFGFGNVWAKPAAENSQTIELGGMSIRIITAPYFLATKLDAFVGRGSHDPQLSHDLEDIVTVLDRRPEHYDEVIATSDSTLQRFMRTVLEPRLIDEGFRDAVAGHLPPDKVSQARAESVLNSMQRLCDAAAALDAQDRDGDTM